MLKRILFSCILTVTTFCLSFGQTGSATLKGIVKSEGGFLSGVSISAKNTSSGKTYKTLTDASGSFKISNLPVEGKYNVELSHVGFARKSLAGITLITGQDYELNDELVEEKTELEEIVIVGKVIDVAKDRQTPVAVSTITAKEIQLKSGNTEFPDLLKNTPSVYITNQAGGYGDSKMFTRGFDQSNTAFLLNGQPINGMEDGNMYWSNWSGMNDIASAIQIQRGLGSSKLAISSVGGTVNIVTKATDKKQGGWASFTTGNNEYYKATIGYNTGLQGKWGASALLTHWQGNGWAEGTKGQGQNYFLSVGFKPNSKNDFNLLITGAPQWHDQNFTKTLKTFYPKGDSTTKIARPIKYNSNIGQYKGKELSERRNYYHKPIANLNWTLDINRNTSLSTVLYASWGRGGGTGSLGSSKRTTDGYLDFGAIETANVAANGASKYIIRGSVNNHQWYGLVTNFNTKLAENLNLNVGLDVRDYKGDHFREITNLVGAQYYNDTKNTNIPNHHVSTLYKAHPWSAISKFAAENERIDYDYSERITYGGLFSQIEYVAGAISAYAQGSVSTQSHIRWDRFNYTPDKQKSEKITNPGFNIKGGINYNVDNYNSFYVNAGYYSRQPYHDNLYLNFKNEVNTVAENEKITGLEAGYKLRYQSFSVNINLYRTSWANRIETSIIADGDSLVLSNGKKHGFANGGFANTANLNQLHQGVELDVKYKIARDLTAKGYASFGDWKYKENASRILYADDRTEIDRSESLFVDGANVGGSAQTTSGLGLDYNPSKGFGADASFNYYSRLYAEIGPLDKEFNNKVNKGTVKLPSYGLLDLGVHYSFDLKGKQSLRLRINVYNVFGTQYIAYASSNIHPSTKINENYNGVNINNNIQWGQTATWNATLKYSF